MCVTLPRLDKMWATGSAALPIRQDSTVADLASRTTGSTAMPPRQPDLDLTVQWTRVLIAPTRFLQYRAGLASIVRRYNNFTLPFLISDTTRCGTYTPFGKLRNCAINRTCLLRAQARLRATWTTPATKSSWKHDALRPRLLTASTGSVT